MPVLCGIAPFYIIFGKKQQAKLIKGSKNKITLDWRS